MAAAYFAVSLLAVVKEWLALAVWNLVCRKIMTQILYAILFIMQQKHGDGADILV
jgi:hypothetical protein